MGIFTMLLQVGSAVAQYDLQKEQADYQREQEQIQSNLNAVKERRAKVEAFKEMKRAQAEVTQVGVQSGGNFLSSSGYQGGQASIGSQFSSNEAYRADLNRLQTALGGNRSGIDAAQSRAAIWQLGTSLYVDTFGELEEFAIKGS